MRIILAGLRVLYLGFRDFALTPPFNTSGIISSVLYALPATTITVPASDFNRQETLIITMDISGTGVPEDRIVTLEKKVRDLDALVKGLVDEFLDFKAVAMKLARDEGERSREELKRAPVAQGTAFPSGAAPSESNTVIRPKGTRPADVPAAPAEPTMVRIMQTDGTMKMEARYGDKSMTNSAAGYGKNRKGTPVKANQSALIYAADEEKSGPKEK